MSDLLKEQPGEQAHDALSPDDPQQLTTPVQPLLHPTLIVPSLLLIATNLIFDPYEELLTLLDGGAYSPGGGKRGGW